MIAFARLRIVWARCQTHHPPRIEMVSRRGHAPCSVVAFRDSMYKVMTPRIPRRTLLAGGVVLAASRIDAYNFATAGSSAVDEAIRSSMTRRKIPAAVAMFADERRTLYSGAFGRRDSAGP